MAISAQLIDCKVDHTRYTPKKHSFGASFFWFSIDIDHIDEDFNQLPLVSRNKWNIFQFRDDDHIDFDQGNIRANVEYFLKQNNEDSKPKKIILWTNLRCFGYVFNPVSFYFLTMADDSQRVIMEVGNTFNELKPFLVPKSAFKGNRAEITVKKHFYVSPFIALDTLFTFKLRFDDKSLSIIVNSDKEDGTKVLTAALTGQYKELSSKSLLLSLLKHPFVTLKIITMIHWHALLLWLKKIPYISKDDNPHLQQGNMRWKK